MAEEIIRTDIDHTEEESRLAFYDCDYKNRIKLSSILKLTGQIAGNDYTRKGLGHRFLWERGFVFLLSKVSFHITRYPREPEILTLRTWECGKKGVQFMRGFTVKSGGELCIDGYQSWIVVNPETRKIVRPKEFPWVMPQLEIYPENAQFPTRVSDENAVFAGSRKVVFSDLDANGHVYNANYADIAADFLPQDVYERSVKDFLICFSHEAKLGDTIDISTDVSAENAVIIGTNAGNPCFEMQLGF